MFSPFNRWPFIPHPQGHRACFLDEAKCFVFYISLGRGLLHPRCPDSLYDFRPVVRMPYQWIRTCDFLCFSLSFGKSRYEGRDLPFFPHLVSDFGFRYAEGSNLAEGSASRRIASLGNFIRDNRNSTIFLSAIRYF
jgi:hypothetical protein